MTGLKVTSCSSVAKIAEGIVEQHVLVVRHAVGFVDLDLPRPRRSATAQTRPAGAIDRNHSAH